MEIVVVSMNRELISGLKEHRASDEEIMLFDKLLSGFLKLINFKRAKYNRVLPLGEYMIDRHEKAELCGFGSGTTVYDSAIVIGSVSVGSNTWIGPNVLLDGSGNLTIGNNCSISAGVQIYTHDSVRWAISGGVEKYEYGPTAIGDNCYIGPNVIIQKDISIGQGSIIGANSLVNKSVPPNSKAYGSPIRIIPIG